MFYPLLTTQTSSHLLVVYCTYSLVHKSQKDTAFHQEKLDLRPRQMNTYCVRSISFSFITSCLCFSWNSFAASSCNRTAQDALGPEGNNDFVMGGKCLFPQRSPLKQIQASPE